MARHELNTTSNVETREGAASQLVENACEHPIERLVLGRRSMLDVIHEIAALELRESPALDQHLGERDEGLRFSL